MVEAEEEQEFESEWWFSRKALRVIFGPLLYLTSWQYRLWQFLQQPPDIRRRKAESEAKRIRKSHDFPTVQPGDAVGREKEFKQVMLSIKYHVFRDKEVRRSATALPPKLFLIKGGSGTGKTYFAEAVMRWAFEEGLNYGLLVNHASLKPEDVYTMWYGQSAQRLSEFFQSTFMKPSIVLVDEFQAFGKKFSSSTEVGMEETRVQTVFLEKVDELQKRNYRTVLFISTTSIESVIDTIRRRGVVGTIDLDAGINRENLIRIAATQCVKHGITLNPEQIVDGLEESIRAIGGTSITPADIVNGFNIVINKKMQALADSLGEGQEKGEVKIGRTVTLEDFRLAAKSVKSYSAEERTEAAKRAAQRVRPQETYEHVGGLKGIKEEVIKELSVALNAELALKAKYIPPKGFIFNGPPGTGKTLLAKAIARENNVWFYEINGPSILQGLYGDPERTIRNIFEDARKNSPAIIFFDEIDSIAPRRGTTDPLLDRVTSQLITEIDGFVPLTGVVVIGSTNRLEALDPALLERFTHHFQFTYPKSINEKEEIVQIHLGQYLDIAHEEVTTSAVMELFSGRVLSPRKIADVINESNRLRTKELDGARVLVKAFDDGPKELSKARSIYSQEEHRLSEVLGVSEDFEILLPLLRDIDPSSYPLRLYHIRKAIEQSSEETVEEARKMISSTVRAETAEIGKAYGLVALGEGSAGGFVTAVEVVVNRMGSGQVRVIGSEFGESIKASAEDAFVFINSISDWRYKNYDLFVELVTPAKGMERAPAGFGITAAPVSGPSAGIAISVAMISSLTGLKVDPTVVVTGAITAKGEVWPVGGMDYRGMGKVEAALADKYVRKLVIPEYNLRKLNESGGLEALQKVGIDVRGVKDVVEAAIECLEGQIDKQALTKALLHG